MRTVTVSTSMIVPWPEKNGKCVVKEVEIDVVFQVYPGEKQTRDHPGCDPEAEEVEVGICVPIESEDMIVFEDFDLDGSARDLLGDDEMERLVSRAIQLASEEDQDDKEFAAETRWESNHDMD